MSDHTFIPYHQLCKIEDEVFSEFLFPKLAQVSSWQEDVMVTDTCAVRYYTNRYRHMGDIDLLFTTDNPKAIVDKIMAYHDNEIITAVPSGFYRVLYQIGCADPIMQPSQFLIDFHINSIYMNNKPILSINKSTYAKVAWKPIRSISGNYTVLMPTPDSETLFAIKTRKAIGNDDIDILAMILAGHPATSEILCLDDRQIEVLTGIAENIDNVYLRYCTYHYQKESSSEKAKAIEAVRVILSGNLL